MHCRPGPAPAPSADVVSLPVRNLTVLLPIGSEGGSVGFFKDGRLGFSFIGSRVSACSMLATLTFAQVQRAPHPYIVSSSWGLDTGSPERPAQNPRDPSTLHPPTQLKRPEPSYPQIARCQILRCTRRGAEPRLRSAQQLLLIPPGSLNGKVRRRHLNTMSKRRVPIMVRIVSDLGE